MPTRSALIPADVPTALGVVLPDLIEMRKYVLQNISRGGQVLKYSELPAAPAATDRAHLLGSFERTAFSLDGTNQIWVWGDGQGVWVVVTDGE